MVRVDVPTERYVHPLRPNTASRFVETVPRYRVDWIVLSYSKAAIGTLALSVLMVRVEALTPWPISASPRSDSSNPSRSQRTDQALAPYIERSIVGSCALNSEPASVYPPLGWQACNPSNAAACADELRMEA